MSDHSPPDGKGRLPRGKPAFDEEQVPSHSTIHNTSRHQTAGASHSRAQSVETVLDDGSVMVSTWVPAGYEWPAPAKPAPRYCTGRVFRDGFSRGFRDALRLAAREVDDPDVWAVLDGLADEYGLVR
jgi:hypothetical protein